MHRVLHFDFLLQAPHLRENSERTRVGQVGGLLRNLVTLFRACADSALRRGVVQLTVLAYILTPGFALNRWWLTMVYSIILLLVSSAEAVSRPPAAYEVLPSLQQLFSGSQASIVLDSLIIVP